MLLVMGCGLLLYIVHHLTVGPMKFYWRRFVVTGLVYVMLLLTIVGYYYQRIYLGLYNKQV